MNSNIAIANFRHRSFSSPRSKAILIAVFLVGLVVCGNRGWGQVTKTWVPTAGGAWTTAGNWNPSGVPGTTDHVRIPGDQSGNITGLGNITITGLTIDGNCNLISTAGTGSYTTLTITGSLSVASNKTLTVGTNNTGRLNFTLTSTTTGNIAGTVYMNSYSGSGYDRIFTNSGDLTVASAGLVTGQNSSDFVLNSAATLRIANAAGITTSGTTGAVQIPGTRTFNAGANYIYNGTAAQAMGTGFPTNLTGKLTINNPGNNVTLGNARTIANGGSIDLVAGTLVAATNLTMATTSTINRSEGSITGTLQGTGVYDVNYTGNSKTAGPELLNTGLRNITVNLTSGQTLTSSNAFAPDNNLTVTQGNLVLQAIDGDYAFVNVIVSTNGTLTHSVPWDNAPNRKIGISGNLDVTGIFNPTVRSHVNMNGAGAKTIRTGDNAASTMSILTFNDGTYSANGTLKTNQEVWAMFGSTGSFSTAGYNVTFASMNNNQGTVNVNGGSLTINSTCEIGYGGSTGAVNVSSGTFNINGNLIINSNGSLTCTNAPSINIGGNWTNNGTFTRANSTVTFNGGAAQSIGGNSIPTFYNLAFSNTIGAVTFGAATSISNNFSIASGSVANLGTFTHSAVTLTLGGSGTPSGSWGSSSSSAAHKNNIYFAAFTGIVNVGNGSCGSVTFTTAGHNVSCYGGSDGSIDVTVTSGNNGPYTYSLNNGGSYIGTLSGTYPNYTITGLTATTHKLRIKDANECESANCP